MTDSKQHSELEPISYEALAENNQHTHANLTFCIRERQRLEEQLEAALAFIERVSHGDFGLGTMAQRNALEFLDSNPASEPEAS